MNEEEAISEVLRRKRLADYYYDNFRKYCEAKDLLKASEFLWGSINAVAYAIGLFYGRKLADHKSIRDFIARLATARGDEEMIDQLASAESIHANFYHGFMDDFTFEVSRRKAEALLEKLAKVLSEKLEEVGVKRSFNP